MKHITKLAIYLTLQEGDKIEDVVSGLPDHCAATFKHTRGTCWFGEFRISCPIAPKLADGDFADDFAPHFPALLHLKTSHSAEYELFIAVGDPAAEFFELESHSVALLAALGASIIVETAQWVQKTAAVGH